MNDKQAMRRQWETLLITHHGLVWSHLKALGTDFAPLIARHVRATTIHVGTLTELLDPPLA